MKVEINKQVSKRTFSSFRLCSLLSTILWGILFFISTRAFQSVTAADYQDYQRLMRQSDSSKKPASASYQAQQHRFNVNKQLLFTRGTDRLQAYLRSANSELIFNQEEHRTELIEHFTDLHCLIQEKLVDASSANPQQYIRYIEADTAAYHYKTRRLVAHDVEIFRYLIPGMCLPSSIKNLNPMMQGSARQIEWSLSNQERPFKVYGFQGVLQELGGAL